MSGGALAADLNLTVGVHLVSKHLSNDEGRKLREFNPGMYVNYKGATIGSYLNSHNRQTTYVGYQYEYKDTFGIFVGGGNGYKKGRITPMIVPSVQYKGVRLMFGPKVDGVTRSHVLHLAYERRF